MSNSGHSYNDSKNFTDKCHELFSPYIYSSLGWAETFDRSEEEIKRQDQELEIDYCAVWKNSGRKIHIQERHREVDSCTKKDIEGNLTLNIFYNDFLLRGFRWGSKTQELSETFKLKDGVEFSDKEDADFFLVYSVIDPKEKDPQKAVIRTIVVDLKKLSRLFEEGKIVPNEIPDGRKSSGKGYIENGVYHCQQGYNYKKEIDQSTGQKTLSTNSTFFAFDPFLISELDPDIIYTSSDTKYQFRVPFREKATPYMVDRIKDELIGLENFGINSSFAKSIDFNNLSYVQSHKIHNILKNCLKECENEVFCETEDFMTSQEIIDKRAVENKLIKNIDNALNKKNKKHFDISS